MSRLPTITAFIAALVVLGAMAGLVGCANGNNAVTPSRSDLTANASPVKSPSGEGLNLGYFQFVFGDDGTVKVEEAEPLRGAELNVTKFASVVIENFFFNEQERNWYITATLKNISPFTGYDVLAVFHTLGNKFVINQDGFVWALPPIFPEPTRCAFIAYGKNQPERVFPPMHQDTRTIVIHQPDGVPKLAPLGFWIEGYANPRKFPGVEDLKVELLPIDIYPPQYQLTGFVWDHQSPSSDLSVWADCTSFNGQNYAQMFDDGQHGDGEAGDNIFGCVFAGDPDDGFYVITVYAYDPQENKGENDVGFWHGDQVPCDKPFEHYPFETIDKGEHSGITELTELVINDPETWHMIWVMHAGIYDPMPPPPPINFEKNTVIGVWTGDRPTNNHMVTIKDVYFDPCEKLVTVLYDYTPHKGCGPLDVITDPFHIVVLPKFTWDTYFVGTEVDCPPPPPDCAEEIPFLTIITGTQSGIHEGYLKLINSQEGFNILWKAHTSGMWPPPPPPAIDFTKHSLIAAGLGDRPTGGFECIIQKICHLTDGNVGVFLLERIPGPECPVEQIITQPFHWVVVPKVQAATELWKEDFVYSCGGGEDCDEPQLFWPIDEGNQTGHPPGEFVIKNQDQWAGFWALHKGPGAPPPAINFQEHIVLAMLVGERPSTGFWVGTTEVCLNTNPDGTIQMDVKYTEHQPGQNCEVLWVLTYPYQIVVVPRFDGPVFFHKTVEVYDCPPNECVSVPWYQLADGPIGCADPGEYGFGEDMNAAELFWKNVHCNDVPPMPPFPDPIQNGWMAPFGIQLHECPTSGYYLTIDDVCVKGCEVFVTYTVHIPGPNCVEDPVITRPWLFGVAELPPIDCIFKWTFEKHEEVYDCPGDCVNVPFQPTEDGVQSCDEAGEYGFQGFGDLWHQHWWAVHCWDPSDPGYVPSVPPADPNTQWVPFEIQLGERKSTGYYVTVDNVCIINGCDVYVDYTENIPGPNCIVAWITTKPWLFSIAQLPLIYCPYNWHFTKKEVVYDCPQPCTPVPFYALADGNQSCADPGEYGWQTDEGYKEFWHKVHCYDPDIPPLPIDPDPIQGGIMYHFGIQLPERPTTGYYLTIDNVCIDGCDVYIDYTENIPGQTCVTEPVITKPWIVAAAEFPPVFCHWTWHFTKHEVVYECTEPCWYFLTIASGTFGGWEPGGWFFQDLDSWTKYWMTYHPDTPIPPVDFAGGWGAYAIHLGSRPTSGYDVSVYEICQSEDPFGAAVRWMEEIPGETCQVLPVVTSPWTVVTFPLVDLPYFDEGHQEVYQCK